MADLGAATGWSKKYDEVVNLYKKHHVSGRSMIHIVAEQGRHDLIEAAIDMDYKAGALLNLKTGANGWAPLHFSAQEGKDAFVKALLKKEGVDINAKTTKSGQTALHIATTARKVSTVNLLLEHKIKIDSRDNDGKTALHNAAREGHLDIVKALLKKDAKIEAKTNNGETPLHLAASQGKDVVVKYLVANNADTSVKVKDGSYKGLTPREIAIRKNHPDVVKLLK